MALVKMFRRMFSIAVPKHAKEIMAKSLPKKIPIPEVNNIIMVSSAKGGVGKSTVAVNVAIALSKIGSTKQIGLLDSDVFGPSIPQLMGVDGIQPDVDDQGRIIPLQNYGVKCMSMGSLIKRDSAVVWRGLMVMKAIQTLLRQVAWGPLDVLLIDTPPGTGDAHLSLIQNLPIRGSLIVSTSHPLALSDTRRGIEMLLKLNVPLLGIVENMAGFVCPVCKSTSGIWRIIDTTEPSGAAKLAKEYKIPLLCQIPLEPIISNDGEKGVPVMFSHPNSVTASTFIQLARRVGEIIH